MLPPALLLFWFAILIIGAATRVSFAKANAKFYLYIGALTIVGTLTGKHFFPDVGQNISVFICGVLFMVAFMLVSNLLHRLLKRFFPKGRTQ